MRIDLHNHTTLCHHATGSMEEYIACAIEKNIDVFGFSCHAPMAFDEKYRMSKDELLGYCEKIHSLKERYQGQIQILCALEVDYILNKDMAFDEKYRMSKDELLGYCEKIHSLKERYQGQIQILCALEVDYILNKEYLIESQVLEYPFDYLIGSVHFLDNWGFDNPEFIGKYAEINIEECWGEYLHSIAQMAQTGLFQIVGHIDLLKLFGHTLPDSQIPNLNLALESIADNHLAIELNPAGLRKPIKEAYPSAKILQKAYKKGIPITFGSDAHALEHIGFGYEKLCDLAKNVGYTHALYFTNKEPVSVRI